MATHQETTRLNRRQVARHSSQRPNETPPQSRSRVQSTRSADDRDGDGRESEDTPEVTRPSSVFMANGWGDALDAAAYLSLIRVSTTHTQPRIKSRSERRRDGDDGSRPGSSSGGSGSVERGPREGRSGPSSWSRSHFLDLRRTSVEAPFSTQAWAAPVNSQ